MSLLLVFIPWCWWRLAGCLDMHELNWQHIWIQRDIFMTNKVETCRWCHLNSNPKNEGWLQILLLLWCMLDSNGKFNFSQIPNEVNYWEVNCVSIQFPICLMESLKLFKFFFFFIINKWILEEVEVNYCWKSFIWMSLSTRTSPNKIGLIL